MPSKSTIAILQEIALGNIFDEEMSYEYYQRKMCRTYSKMFFTPHCNQVRNCIFSNFPGAAIKIGWTGATIAGTWIYNNTFYKMLNKYF